MSCHTWFSTPAHVLNLAKQYVKKTCNGKNPLKFVQF